MYSLFNKLNSSIINNSYSSKDKNFAIIFFSKFKNLLDDYISNYFTKYLFYFLFMAFWILEVISFFNYHYSICIGLKPKLDTVALFGYGFYKFIMNFEVSSYFSSLVYFNLDFPRYILHLLTGESYFLTLLVFLSLVIGSLFIEYYTHKKQISLFTLMYCYLFFTFLVFVPFKMGLFSFEYASIIITFIPFLLTVTNVIKKIELLDLYIVGLMVFLSFIHPIFIILFLFSTIYLFKDSIQEVYYYEINTHITKHEATKVVSMAIVDLVVVVVSVMTLHTAFGVSYGVYLFGMVALFIFLAEYVYSFFIRKK